MVTAERTLLVVHHPPNNGLGQPEYDLAQILANIREALSSKVALAPVSQIVRQHLSCIPDLDAELLPSNWCGVVDFGAWAQRVSRPKNGRIIVGRHTRPQLSKWPDTLEKALQVYPEDDRFEIRMLGAPPDLLGRYGRLPGNWRLMPFRHDGVADFLESLDFYVYYHGSEWIEAFGHNVLEAMASGVPAILPPQFESTFEGAAIYAEPAAVQDKILALHSDATAYAAHVKAARATIERNHGLERLTERLDSIVPGWRPKGPAVVAGERPIRRAVMISSNGVGLGHITRLMAIADRFDRTMETAFLTMSPGFKLVQERGYLAQFIPFHRYTGADPDQWNVALAEEVSDFLGFYRPDTVVFDGNVPYSGLLNALSGFPWINRVWIRRGLWSELNADALGRSASFDAIVEPGEFSARFDTGPTAAESGNVFRTSPIVLVDPAARMSRDDARTALGLPQDRTIVAMMLGAGNNFDMKRLRDQIVSCLLSRPDVIVAEILSPIRYERAPESSDPRHVQKRLFPAFAYSAAFDFVVSGSGYNSFHESMLGAIPSIFVPNEAPEMDNQLLRARHATQIGCGEMLRCGEAVRVKEVIERVMDPHSRAAMIARLRKLELENGASNAAGFIERLTASVRCAAPS